MEDEKEFPACLFANRDQLWAKRQHLSRDSVISNWPRVPASQEQ